MTFTPESDLAKHLRFTVEYDDGSKDGDFLEKGGGPHLGKWREDPPEYTGDKSIRVPRVFSPEYSKQVNQGAPPKSVKSSATRDAKLCLRGNTWAL